MHAATAAKWLAVVALSSGAAGLGVWGYHRRPAVQPRTGSLTIDTTPQGVDARIAGQSIGKTPLSLSLAAGPYEVELVTARGSRFVNGTLGAGGSVVQHVELGLLAAVPAVAGSLRVQTDTDPMTVIVDGTERGVSPLTIETLDPGPHRIVVRSERGTVRRTVTIKPGETVSLAVSTPESATMPPGWLVVASPVSVLLRENGKLIGTSDTERLMLASGKHEIELVNDALGFRAVRKIVVTPGRTTIERVELPAGTLNINAQPWAEVWINGERVGETPLANLSPPIGSHEIVFRHPQLGERRETVVVTANQPARLGVDMRRK